MYTCSRRHSGCGGGDGQACRGRVCKRLVVVTSRVNRVRAQPCALTALPCTHSIAALYLSGLTPRTQLASTGVVGGHAATQAAVLALRQVAELEQTGAGCPA